MLCDVKRARSSCCHASPDGLHLQTVSQRRPLLPQLAKYPITATGKKKKTKKLQLDSKGGCWIIGSGREAARFKGTLSELCPTLHSLKFFFNQLYFESYKESPDRQKENSRNCTDQETGATRPHPAPYRPSQTQPPSRQGLPQSTSPLSFIETTPIALNTPYLPSIALSSPSFWGLEAFL